MTALALPVDPDPPRLVRPPRSLLTLGACTAFGALAGLVLAAAGLGLGPWGPIALLTLPAVAVTAWRAPHLIIVGLVLLLPAGNVVVGSVEVAQLGAALAVLAVLTPAAARLDWRLPPWPVAVPLGAFALVAALATAGAADADLAFRLDIQLLVVLLLTVAVTTALRTPAHVHLALVALIVAGGLTALPAVFGAGPTESHYGGGVITGRAVGAFAQPNELGLFSAVLVVLAVGIGLSAGSARLRVLCLVSGGLLVAALGLSLSRGAWFGAIAGLVALAVLVPQSRRALAVLGVALMTIGAVLAAFGVGPVAEVLTRATSVVGSGANPYDQRPLIWDEALRMYAEAPLVGHGPGGFSYGAASDALRSGAFLDVEHAHNLLLNVAVEFGAAGLVALLALMVGLLVLVRRGRAAGSSLPGVLAAALVAVVAHGMVDYPLRNPLVLTTVWLVLALLVAAATTTTASTSAATASRPEDPR